MRWHLHRPLVGQKVSVKVTKYTVAKMRLVLPGEKDRAKNPDKFGTVHGEFFNEKGEPYSFPSKVVTFADIKNPDTVIDIAGGILILPSGTKGRKQSASASQEDIDSLLAAARETATA